MIETYTHESVKVASWVFTLVVFNVSTKTERILIKLVTNVNAIKIKGLFFKYSF